MPMVSGEGDGMPFTSCETRYCPNRVTMFEEIYFLMKVIDE